MKIIKDALRDFDIRHSISIFDIYFLPHKKVKPCALQYNQFYQFNQFSNSSTFFLAENQQFSLQISSKQHQTTRRKAA